MQIKIKVEMWDDPSDPDLQLVAEQRIVINTGDKEWETAVERYNDDADSALAAVCVDVGPAIERGLMRF